MRKEEYASRDFYDVWLPELAPSPELFSFATAEPLTNKRWATFARRYRSEMSKAGAQHLLGLLVALSRQTDFSVGCYCADEAHCHRTLLRELLVDAGAEVV